MSSGVTVSNEAKTVYEEVKKDKKYRYIIYHIKDEKVIDVESTGPRNATYSEFLEELQKFKNECRCPESSKIKMKMLYSSSYDALKKALVGIYRYVQACDFEEASKATIDSCFKCGNK
ncbi:cofilin/actin-depolymerizing factor homolog isoform X2 [Ixodes scapularis]|uniref:cofilin/actin-depolymerizing factor homolog isoform X2 n=1 Tax=Ixodes scapularis TaxID=6945 RepID=UPI0011617BF6|nr:cofilin/actin-depolymerizing factor homolog isoform X2 [Ixodes scapularis]